MPSFVYLLEEESHPGEVTFPWTKIGYSKNPPEWRLNANLKRGNPRNLRFFAVFEFEGDIVARKAEKEAHKKFEAYRHQKEWFNIESEVVAHWFVGTGAIMRTETPTI